MTYCALIQRGVVVFDEPVPLEEGTALEVQPVGAPGSPAARPRRGTAEALQQLRNITWAGDPDELRRLEKEVQAMRDADLTPLDERSPLDET